MAKKSSPVHKAVNPKSKKELKVKSKLQSAPTKKIAGGYKSVKSTGGSQTVERLQAQLAQRNAELAIINSIQQGPVLQLVEPDGKTMKTALALGMYAEENLADPLILGEGITGSIAQSGIAEVIDNIDQYPRGVHIPGTPGQEETPETMMAAPLIASNRAIGALSVYKDRNQGVFSKTDLDFLVGLGRQAAIAIENARLFAETEQRAAELSIISIVGQTLRDCFLSRFSLLDLCATNLLYTDLTDCTDKDGFFKDLSVPISEICVIRVQKESLRNSLGIGIATGKMIAGYTGTQSRATYTCIGDTVNLAARIENHTKTVLRPLLIDFYTRKGLSDSYKIEDPSPVLFKGKHQPINIFSVTQ